MAKSRQRKKKKPVQYIPKQVSLPGKDSDGNEYLAKVKLNATKAVKHMVKSSNVGVSPKKEKPFTVPKEHVDKLRHQIPLPGIGIMQQLGENKPYKKADIRVLDKFK